MPHRNSDRRQQKGVRQAVTAGGHHEIKNERVEYQANKNRKLQAEPIRYALAQKLASENVKHSAEESRRPECDTRRAKHVGRNPHQ